MEDNSCRILRKSNMLLLHLSTIVLFGFFEASRAVELSEVVYTTLGPVQGSILTTHNSVKYAAYRGIPYAKSPVGNLRFKPPVDPDSWTKVYNATAGAPDCIQLNPYTSTVMGTEDCLFINVATPKKSYNWLEKLIFSPKLMPVMVWIYGGAYVGGSSGFPRYTPDNAVERSIVYVSLNYRAGAFGYLALNHTNASGNAGLKDLVQGLKWVQKNIAKFGGDPKNVTIMGQSSGGASVGYMVLSSSAAGLFHAAISMSGVPLDPWAFQNTSECLRQARRLTSLLGMSWTDPDSMLNKLYTVPASDIVLATANISTSFAPFGPTLEDESVAIEPLLTECIVTKYRPRRYNQVPYIIGYEDQETLSFVTLPIMTRPMIEKYIATARMYRMDVPECVSIAKKQLNQNNMTWFNDTQNVDLWKFINETSAVLFMGAIDQTQKFLANNEKPVYNYHISFYTDAVHAPAWNNSLRGPGHSDDLSFIFYNPIMNYSTSLSTPVGRTMARMTEMWTNLAKYGDPTPSWVKDGYPLGITWPDSRHSHRTLNIGNELTIEPRFSTDAMTRYEKSSSKYLSEATQCDGD